MKRAALTLFFAAMLAAPAVAQDWATVENCTVETPRIHDEVFAPSDRATLEAEAAEISNGVGKFWQITSADGAVSHLWGTFHSSDPMILNLPDKVQKKIEDSRIVAVEIDYTSKSRDAYREAQMMEGRFREATDPFALLPADGTIADLPQDVSEWVRERAIELGWTEDFDLVMSLPGIAEMLLSDPCEDFRQGVIPIQDDFIQLLGRLAGADILSLEQPDDLIAYLAADEDTARAMIQTYAAYLQPGNIKSARATAFALYLEGRLGLWDAWEASYQHSINSPEGLASLEKTDAYLLTYRNHRFLETLAAPLVEGDIFVAVGAAHIPGESGMVALLRAAGYEVSRIPLPGEAP